MRATIPTLALGLLGASCGAGTSGGLPAIRAIPTVIRTHPLPAGKKARLVPVGNSGRVAIGVLHLAPGRLPAHYHAGRDEVVYVLRGRGEMLLGTEKRSVGPGDLVVLPQGTVHGVTVTEPITALRMMAPPDDPRRPDRVPVR